MRKALRKLKIKEKLFLILFFTSSIISCISLCAFQFAISSYNNMLQQETRDILMLSSNIIEAKIKEIDEISFKIATDATFQNLLKNINSANPTYERYAALYEVENIIRPWSQYRDYIASIGIVDNDDKQYSWGLTRLSFKNTEQIIDIKNKAYSNQGRVVWLEPNIDNSLITVARNIRDVKNLSFQSLGVLTFNIYPSKLFNKNQLLESKYFETANMYILSDENIVIYRSDGLSYNPDWLFELNQTEDYFINKTKNNKVIINYMTSPYTNWKFVIAIPYSSIYSGIVEARNIMLIVCMLAFGVAILFGMWLYRSITTPVNLLITQMRAVGQGNFGIKDNYFPRAKQTDCRDEIEELQHNFYKMVKKIDELIEENYIKHMTMQEAELKALQAQINPHFLYNTLESINWMAKINKCEPIAEMAKSLGNLFRNSVNTNNLLIPLKDELSILNDYLTIQHYRYEDRLNVRVDIPSEYNYVMIPKLSLQPLIENSIHHGLERMEETCQISLRASKMTDGDLCIEVSDNGPGISRGRLEKLNNKEIDSSCNSIGIKNIDKRLKIVFGDKYGLRIDSQEGHGTHVYMFIPCKEG